MLESRRTWRWHATNRAELGPSVCRGIGPNPPACPAHPDIPLPTRSTTHRSPLSSIRLRLPLHRTWRRASSACSTDTIETSAFNSRDPSYGNRHHNIIQERVFCFLAIAPPPHPPTCPFKASTAYGSQDAEGRPQQGAVQATLHTIRQ